MSAVAEMLHRLQLIQVSQPARRTAYHAQATERDWRGDHRPHRHHIRGHRQRQQHKSGRVANRDLRRLHFKHREAALARGGVHAQVQHYWPGNIRELLNVVKASYFNAATNVIRENELLFSEFSRQAGTSPALPEPRIGFNLQLYLAEIRSKLIESAL